MPVGTVFHPRTLRLCESLNFRDWSGYFAVSAYETHHEHEYNAIRNAAALIDISPLFKYLVSGPDATRLVNRIITRDAARMSVGQVYYTSWCDDDGKVIDDGTVARLGEEEYRWTAADPNLRWFRQNAVGLRVSVEDVSERIAALAVQGPLAAKVLRATEAADIDALRYFRVTEGKVGGVPVDISRTGYTGDLGYEIWMPSDRALTVWDALMEIGQPYGLKPSGMLALDVARLEAGLLLIDIDFNSSKKALIESQKYTPFELGFSRLVQLDKPSFVGQGALRAEQRRGPAKKVVGLVVDWDTIEGLYDRVGLPPVAPAAASRVHVPVVRNGRQIGHATTTGWSPLLKRLIALATLEAPHFAQGTSVEMEVTVEAVRHTVAATVVPTPFFNPPRKTATPPP